MNQIVTNNAFINDAFRIPANTALNAIPAQAMFVDGNQLNGFINGKPQPYIVDGLERGRPTSLNANVYRGLLASAFPSTSTGLGQPPPLAALTDTVLAEIETILRHVVITLTPGGRSAGRVIQQGALCEWPSAYGPEYNAAIFPGVTKITPFVTSAAGSTRYVDRRHFALPILGAPLIEMLWRLDFSGCPVLTTTNDITISLALIATQYIFPSQGQMDAIIEQWRQSGEYYING